MNSKRAWLVIGFLVVLISGSVVYLVLTKPTAQPTPPDNGTQTNNQEPPAPDKPVTRQGEGAYVDYSPAAFSQASGRKVLFFHASWCPQCRQLEASIKEKGVPADMTIFKVNYDSATELRQRYAVNLQTTIVEINDQGKEITKFVAYDDPTLPAVLRKLNP
jgi:thiol-disulfide isomerase/thioredoxin